VIEKFKYLAPEWKLVVNKKCKIYLANYEEIKKKNKNRK
tara:strand:- start:1074 stop:1190 length:117 start_codon:yes stop_codon:yes gene_type:complete